MRMLLMVVTALLLTTGCASASYKSYPDGSLRQSLKDYEERTLRRFRVKEVGVRRGARFKSGQYFEYRGEAARQILENSGVAH